MNIKILDTPCVLMVSKYMEDDSLAIVAYGAEDAAPFCKVTVWIDHSHRDKSNVAAVDSNNVPGIEFALASAGIAKTIDRAESGYCTYPIMEFDLTELKKYC